MEILSNNRMGSLVLHLDQLTKPLKLIKASEVGALEVHRILLQLLVTPQLQECLVLSVEQVAHHLITPCLEDSNNPQVCKVEACSDKILLACQVVTLRTTPEVVQACLDSILPEYSGNKVN